MPTSILIPDKEYFSIKEVSHLTQVASYVLRYWETEFKLLRPVRRESGHRKYIKKDIDLILRIKDLLYNKKFTIAGAKKFLLERRKSSTKQLKFELKESTAAVDLLKKIKKDLENINKILK